MKSHKKPTKGISSIADIAKQYTSKVALQKKILELGQLVAAQDQTIDSLAAELTNLKIDGPKSTSSGEIKIYENIPESEKLIADVQLQRLKEAALGRDLTLEETRKYEIFSKVKNLNKEDIPVDPKLPRDVTPRTLLEIAGSKIKEPNG